jgi:sortase A
MLLKVGVFMMTLALAFAAVVALVAFLDEPMEPAAAVKSTARAAVEPLVRSDPGVKPWVEERVPLPRQEPRSRPEPADDPAPEPEPRSSESTPAPEPDPQPQPETREERTRTKPLPVGQADWPLPTEEQVEATNQPRRYELAPGAILGLTIESLGLYDVPVLNHDGPQALNRGVVHVPETSLPWSQTPERNVFLAGHRLGWPGTGSHLVFYRLNELGDGEEIVLRDRDGARYRYRVIDTFVVNPTDTWVMGRVRGRDLLTLQTCTPIPSFDKRLIVRAERV